MQNKGYYGVQGHSRSSRSVPMRFINVLLTYLLTYLPIESPYATSY